jgi:hypothetical protein
VRGCSARHWRMNKGGVSFAGPQGECCGPSRRGVRRAECAEKIHSVDHGLQFTGKSRMSEGRKHDA